MARLPRLTVAGLPHLISQRAQDGQAMVRDDADRLALLGLLRDAALQHHVAVHAYALLDTRLDLVATPQTAAGLSLLMQSVARRHAAAYNRRHDRRGGLWEGRFRAAVLDPQTWLLRCLVQVERSPAGGGWVSRAPHAGSAAAPAIVDPDAYWRLGNTPFEREAAYENLRQRALTSAEISQMEGALRGGWPLGAEAFVAALGAGTPRPVRPRSRGRPPRVGAL
ncbi:MAG: transposase [Pseudomonadota bacterium]